MSLAELVAEIESQQALVEYDRQHLAAWHPTRRANELLLAGLFRRLDRVQARAIARLSLARA